MPVRRGEGGPPEQGQDRRAGFRSEGQHGGREGGEPFRPLGTVGEEPPEVLQVVGDLVGFPHQSAEAQGARVQILVRSRGVGPEAAGRPEQHAGLQPDNPIVGVVGEPAGLHGPHQGGGVEGLGKGPLGKARDGVGDNLALPGTESAHVLDGRGEEHVPQEHGPAWAQDGPDRRGTPAEGIAIHHVVVNQARGLDQFHGHGPGQGGLTVSSEGFGAASASDSRYRSA